MNILFSIYTNKHGHQVHGFDAFDKNGKSCFDQVIEYATVTYNDLNDVPKIYQLTEVPYDVTKVVRVPAEWEAMLDMEVINPDGWRRSSNLGEKKMTEPITLAEFRERCKESTIFENGHTKGGHKL